jgi:hypothetical protein
MLDVSEFVVMSGMPGVYKVITARKDGLIVEDFDTKRRQFVASRTSQFSAFETISIYTDTDTKSLGEVLTSMKSYAEAGNPMPDMKANSQVLRDYFIAIMPDHDRDRVHTSDIKKIIKWYNFIDARQLWKEKVEEKTEETAPETTPTEA